MLRRHPIAASVTLSLTLLATTGAAQAAGFRAAGDAVASVVRLAMPTAGDAERVITIEAVAEVRVVPSRLRVVFAVSAEGPDTAGASTAVRTLLAETRTKLQTAGVAPTDIDADFIAARPIYGWRVEKQGGHDVLAEVRTGVRVQHNLHVAVADEGAALAAIEAAAARDGVELLAVDYWSHELEAQQVAARRKAIAAAQAKAQLLLAVFPEPPMPINVAETTRIFYPHQLYHGLSASAETVRTYYSRDELPRVPAQRPMRVYYRGLFDDIDAPVAAMPGKREIEIVSTVRLYYAAPGRPARDPK